MKPSTDFFPTDAAGTKWTRITGIAGIDGNGGAVDAEGLPPALEMGNTGQSAEFQESVARLEQLRSEIHRESKAAKLDNPNCAVGRGFVVPVVPSESRSLFTATATTDAFGMGASWWEADYDRDAERRQARAAAREARGDRYADAFLVFWDACPHREKLLLGFCCWFLSWVVATSLLNLLCFGVMAIWHAMGGK